MTIETIKTDQGEIEYPIVGRGTPVLFFHGGHSNCRETLCSKEHAEHAQEMIKNSKLLCLDSEWGHLLWIGKDSNESIRKTIEFIEQ